MRLRWTKSRKLVLWLAACSLLPGCVVYPPTGGSWPSTLDPTRQSPGISRTVNGVRHVLRAPILGPIPFQFRTYSGPKDWQGNPAIGDPYVDSLNFVALATCETGVPGGNPKGYNPNDSDSGGARYGAYQTAKQTWHYAVDLNNDEGRDPYQDPRDAPLWYQTYRDKRKMLKELIRGPGSAWRYPPETHHKSCGARLFTGRPSTAPTRIP
ncbi:MAG: hypothetical protein ACXW1S_03570 [Acidimicrobiia bacterium]